MKKNWDKKISILQGFKVVKRAATPLKKDMWRKQLAIGLARAYRSYVISTFYFKSLLHLNVFMIFAEFWGLSCSARWQKFQNLIIFGVVVVGPMPNLFDLGGIIAVCSSRIETFFVSEMVRIIADLSKKMFTKISPDGHFLFST